MLACLSCNHGAEVRARHRGRHEAPAETMADEMQFELGMLLLDPAQQWVDAFASDEASSFFHLIVRRVIEQIPRTREDST